MSDKTKNWITKKKKKWITKKKKEWITKKEKKDLVDTARDTFKREIHLTTRYCNDTHHTEILI